MEIGRSLRGVRAAVFAATCAGVSAAGHVTMSGSGIPAWALLAAVLAMGGAGYVLAGRQRGFAPIAGLMLVGELALHLLFSAAQHAAAGATSSASSASSTSAGSSMSGMSGASDISRYSTVPGLIMPHPVPAAAWLCGGGRTGLGAVGGVGAQAWSSSMAWMSAHDSAGMIAAHVLAGLLCAWWLRQGEAATFRLLRALALLAAPLLVIVWPAAPVVSDLTAGVPDDREEHPPTGRRLLVHAVLRRGPPAPVLCM
jgi:hypothetical protein